MTIFIFSILALLAASIGFIVVQIRAGLAWRLLSLFVVLVFCCIVSSRLAKFNAYNQIQDQYTRNLRPFVGDLETLALSGRTNEFAFACERFQKDFNIWYGGEYVSNFWSLAFETSIAANAVKAQTNTATPK